MKQLTLLLCLFSNSILFSQETLYQDVLFEIYNTSDIHVDGDNIYAALSSNKIQIYENEQWSEPIELQSGFTTNVGITKDDNGVIWYAGGQGLVSYDNGEIEVFNTSNSDLTTNDLKAVHSYKDTLWIVASINDVFRKVGDEIVGFRPFSGSFAPMGDSEMSDDGKLFIGGFNKMALIDQNGVGSFSISGKVNDLFKASNGNIYIAKDNGMEVYMADIERIIDFTNFYGEREFLVHGIASTGEYYGYLDSRDVYHRTAFGDEYIIEQSNIMEPNFEGFFMYKDTLRAYGLNVNGTSSTSTVITTLNGARVDADDDSFYNDVDCDDFDNDVYPGAEELCDEKDNNCDGEIDEGVVIYTVYRDLDRDGYGNDDVSREQCDLPNSAWVEINGDCDDTDADINPDAIEIPNNGIDEDCDGEDLISALHELSNSSINIFPNPAHNLVYISVLGQLQYKVNLYDSQGQMIRNDVNSRFIDIQDLPSGIYIIEILDLDSDKKIFEKIIKS